MIDPQKTFAENEKLLDKLVEVVAENRINTEAEYLSDEQVRGSSIQADLSDIEDEWE